MITSSRKTAKRWHSEHPDNESSRKLEFSDGHPTTDVIDTQLKDIKKKLPLRVLSGDDWTHWITNGYVIVRQAVPLEKVDRLVDLLWTFEEKDSADPSTWYSADRRPHRMPELNNVGMVEIYNHQYLWDTRQERRVYDAFVDIWDREDLWVAIDRANLNPPKKVQGRVNGFIHWDADTLLDPLPIGVQGVLSLSAQGGNVGGFQCVPGLFQNFSEWVKTQPKDRDPLRPDISGFDIVNIDLEPGDLVIFNSLLAHGVRPNYSENSVRIAQYVSMFPANRDNLAERTERITCWRDLDPPGSDAFPGDPRDWEKKNASAAKLTPLGAKLLGLVDWP
jgi:Phytanoyl-CoA dioxygenase (PhyH)